MADGNAGRARAVAEGGGPSPATGAVSAPGRELARRISGAVDVLLLWQPDADRLELSVEDVATGAGFHIEVAPADALDAFYHPYAYAARGDNARRVVPSETSIVDG